MKTNYQRRAGLMRIMLLTQRIGYYLMTAIISTHNKAQNQIM